MMDELKDLVIKAQRGNNNVFEDIYNITKGKAYYLALQLLRNTHDAEDVLQDAFTTAFFKINDAIPESFQGWLDTIVINRAKDVLKKKRPDFFSELKNEDGTVYCPDEKEESRREFLPQENMDYQETRRLVQEIIDELPEEQRMTVMLYYYKEMAVGEIAEYFECSAGTVKSRLNYARKTIKEKVQLMEKKGTKLYSIPVLPFLYWMFSTDAEEIVCISENVIKNVFEGVTLNQTTGKALHTPIDSVAKDIVGNGTKKYLGGKVASMSIGIKTGITAIVATVSITGVIAFSSWTKNTATDKNVDPIQIKNVESLKTSEEEKEDVDVSIIDQVDESKAQEKNIEEINKEAKIAY